MSELELNKKEWERISQNFNSDVVVRRVSEIKPPNESGALGYFNIFKRSTGSNGSGFTEICFVSDKILLCISDSLNLTVVDLDKNFEIIHRQEILKQLHPSFNKAAANAAQAY
jgi:hypothetical protein